MRKLMFLFYDPKLFISAIFTMFVGLPLVVYFSVSGITNAMNASNNYPPAYTGGAPISKVLHLNDGGTVTITCTGAVVKTAQGGTPYREGWVDPSDIVNINSGSDLNGTGRIQSGLTNPYGSNDICPSQSANNQSTNKSSSSTKTKNNKNQTSTTAVLAGSTTTYVTPSQPAQTTTTQTAAPSSPTTLPNTGPGSVLAVGSLTTVFGSIGHYLYQRRRYS